MKKVVYILSGMLFCPLNLQGMHPNPSQIEKESKPELSLVSVNDTNESSMSRLSRKFFGYFGFGKSKSEDTSEQKNENPSKDSPYADNASNVEEFKNQWESVDNTSDNPLSVQIIDANDKEFLVDTTKIWEDIDTKEELEKNKDPELFKTFEENTKSLNLCIDSLHQIKNETENKNLVSILNECINQCNNDAETIQSIKALQNQFTKKVNQENENHLLYYNYKKTLEDREYSTKLIKSLDSLKTCLPIGSLEQINNAQTFEQRTVAMFSAFAIASHQKDLFYGKALAGFHNEVSNQRDEINKMKREMDERTSQMNEMKSKIAQMDEMKKKMDEMAETIKKLSSNKLEHSSSSSTNQLLIEEPSSTEKANLLTFENETYPLEKANILPFEPSLYHAELPKKSITLLKNIVISSSNCSVGNFIYKGSFDSNTQSAKGKGTFSKGASIIISGEFRDNFLDITHPICFQSISKKVSFTCNSSAFFNYDMLHLSNLSEIRAVNREANSITAFTNSQKSDGYIFGSTYIYKGSLDKNGNPSGKGAKLSKDGSFVSGMFNGIDSVFSD